MDSPWLMADESVIFESKLRQWQWVWLLFSHYKTVVESTVNTEYRIWNENHIKTVTLRDKEKNCRYPKEDRRWWVAFQFPLHFSHRHTNPKMPADIFVMFHMRLRLLTIVNDCLQCLRRHEILLFFPFTHWTILIFGKLGRAKKNTANTSV